MFDIRSIERNRDVEDIMEAIESVCFGELHVAGLLRRNWELSDERTIFLGAYDESRLVAFNGFIAHPTTDGRLIFQSCHSATDPDYRGRGLFTSLLRRAEEMLDGDYIVGFPNSNSGPLFKAKLNYEFVDLIRVIIPTRFAGISLSGLAQHEVVQCDEEAVLAWKKREWPEVRDFRHGNSLVWGKFSKRRLGPVLLTMLDAGGMRLAQRSDLDPIMSQLRGAGAHLVRLVLTPDHPLAKAARRQWPGDRTEPFIYRALHGQLAQRSFAASTGMKDAWMAA